MSGFSSAVTGTLGGATTAFSLAGQLQRATTGDLRRVQFRVNNQVVITFDAILQESHNLETQPTSFPVEDGSTVTDHIVVPPSELQLTGVVTDTPLYSRQALVQDAVIAGAGAVLGPVGTLGSSVALSLAKAQYGSLEPSFAAYELLRTLAQGFTGNNPSPPTPFDVVTRMRTYRNMTIKSLQVPRDATTGSSLTFNMQLAALNIVAPQTLQLALSAIPAVSSVKEKLSSGDAGAELVQDFDAGDSRGYGVIQAARKAL